MATLDYATKVAAMMSSIGSPYDAKKLLEIASAVIAHDSEPSRGELMGRFALSRSQSYNATGYHDNWGFDESLTREDVDKWVSLNPARVESYLQRLERLTQGVPNPSLAAGLADPDPRRR